MPNLIGTRPEQVPVNGMLGTAAFMDRSAFVARNGGVADRFSVTYLDLGTIAASGTAAVDAAVATVQRIQAGGALTITFSNLPTGAVSSDIELHCVNFGGKTITWPAGSWIKPGGSYAAAVGNSGVIWQTSGTDRVLVMIDNGAIYYKVMR